ncbi:hypothetical protein GCM10010442_64180 [Kitasatospora kifunensis]
MGEALDLFQRQLVLVLERAQFLHELPVRGVEPLGQRGPVRQDEIPPDRCVTDCV